MNVFFPLHRSLAVYSCMFEPSGKHFRDDQYSCSVRPATFAAQLGSSSAFATLILRAWNQENAIPFANLRVFQILAAAPIPRLCLAAPRPHYLFRNYRIRHLQSVFCANIGMRCWLRAAVTFGGGCEQEESGFMSGKMKTSECGKKRCFLFPSSAGPAFVGAERTMDVGNLCSDMCSAWNANLLVNWRRAWNFGQKLWNSLPKPENSPSKA